MQSRNLIKLLGLTLLAAIGVMAVSASAAQAKWLLLLNGVSVSELHLHLEGLEGKLTAKNGLKIKCASGLGLVIIKSVEGGLKLSGEGTGTLKGCVWVGSEKTCTIKDGEAGAIKAGGTGEAEMVGEKTETVIAKTESANFATIKTEGAFCTLPENEVVSGSTHLLIENALQSTKIKLGKLLQLKLFLGKSEVTELSQEAHISDFLNPEATIGVHLCELPAGSGCV